jgi:hypothetical protein
VRCSRCGNENPALNRFCGMCGATLAAPSDARASASAAPLPTRATEPMASPAVRPAAASAKPAATPVPAQRPPEPVRPREIEPDSQPVISGPSFLGLNQPTRGTSGRGSQSDNAPRSLDYLLEDEEEPKSGAGKLVLIVIALLLALGLGYLRWRNEGLDWLTAGMKKTLGGASSETSSTPATNPGGDSSPTAPAGAPATSAPTTSATNSTSSGAQAPTAGGSTAAAPTSGSSPNNDAVIPVDSNGGAKTPPDVPANSAADKGPAANAAAPTGNDANTTDAANGASAPAANPKKGAGGKAAANADDDAENSDDAESAPAAAKPAPLAKPPAAKPLDVVMEGEKYIYGRGVAQDCDRGVKMVRQAANQSNAKAMISLGALYSAGLCTPRDLPTAYRWFAVALRKEPDNDSLQADLKKLWSEMTPPERQLAIKLSQ